MPSLTTLIATSQQRTDWFAGRSLPSVYKHKCVDRRQVQVLIVDDNADEAEFERIQEMVSVLR